MAGVGNAKGLRVDLSDWGEYEVTVIIPPQTLTVLAKSESEAQKRAVWMIGAAGFEKVAQFKTEERLAAS